MLVLITQNHSGIRREFLCQGKVKMRERTFTKGKQPLDIEEKYFENSLCLEIVITNLMSVI